MKIDPNAIPKKKEFECKGCGDVYTDRHGNFSKSARHKSGFFEDCKKCRNEIEKERIANLSKKRYAMYKKKSALRNEKYRGTKKFKKTVENYKERRRFIRKWNPKFKKNWERLQSYQVKYYWTENQDYFLDDIKKEEL